MLNVFDRDLYAHARLQLFVQCVRSGLVSTKCWGIDLRGLLSRFILGYTGCFRKCVPELRRGTISNYDRSVYVHHVFAWVIFGLDRKYNVSRLFAVRSRSIPTQCRGFDLRGLLSGVFLGYDGCQFKRAMRPVLRGPVSAGHRGFRLRLLLARDVGRRHWVRQSMPRLRLWSIRREHGYVRVPLLPSRKIYRCYGFIKMQQLSYGRVHFYFWFVVVFKLFCG